MTHESKLAIINFLKDHRRDVELNAKYHARNQTERASLNARVRRIQRSIVDMEKLDV